MLGLAEQVRRAHLGVDGLVRNHHGLGRTGEQVDADPAEHLALGLGAGKLLCLPEGAFRQAVLKAEGDEVGCTVLAPVGEAAAVTA